MTAHKDCWILAASALLLAGATAPSAIAAKKNGAQDLFSMSLEQLTSVQVSSVSRHDEPLFDTPAAVYVITRDDIRRSGATSIPEVLRMVPGVEVAQIDANKWAVSARGFNNRFANKMLVMIENRTVYNQLYSGVFWDQTDVLLEDVERIEVVRGPGATLWGANAVNGVINIVTRKAQDTQGALVVAEAGRIDQEGIARYGGHLGASADYRLYGKYLHRDALLAADGASAGDTANIERAGVRLDWSLPSQNSVTLQGDLYDNAEKQRENFDYAATTSTLAPIHAAGGFASVRWEHTRTASSSTVLQAYLRDDRRFEIEQSVHMHSFDLDLQDRHALGMRQNLVWGAGYRWTSDVAAAAEPMFQHPDHVIHLSSGFLQDEIALLPRRLTLTAGAKLLWNTYSHFEYQPGVRLRAKLSPAQTVWASVSRAVRTPSDIDRDDRLDFAGGVIQGLPVTIQISGNPRFSSEIVHAYEAGYRHQFGNSVSVDLAGFVNHYSSLGATAIGAAVLHFNPAPSIVLPCTYLNALSSDSQGAEASLLWNPDTTLHFQGSYTWMQNRFNDHGNPTDVPLNNQDWAAPRNAFDVRGFWSPAAQWSLGAILNGNSPIASSMGLALNNPSAFIVPAHTRLDLRLSRTLGEKLEISASATNLLQARHREFPSIDYVAASQIPRSAYVRLQWTH
jgi:iron complex outermembrane receptor protein